MTDYFQKFITLFGSSATKILILTNSRDCGAAYKKTYNNKLIHTVSSETPESVSQMHAYLEAHQYDLVIIDQIWSKPYPGSQGEICAMPHLELLTRIRENLPPGGQILCIEKNLNYLKHPGDILSAALNIFVRKNSMFFPFDYTRSMKKSGLSDIKRFFLVPDITNFNHIISSERRPVIKFARKSRGISHVFPRNFRAWPMWIAVWLGIDRLLFPWQLIWGQK